MAAPLEIIQGDNYSEDFINSTVLPTDLGYADWTGQWAIVDRLGAAGTTLASGNLVKVDDPNLRLALRMAPADTADVPAGSYKMIVQVTNPTLSFNKEVVQRSVKIKEQGIA